MSIFFWEQFSDKKACADFGLLFSKKTPQNEFRAFLQEKVNFPLLKAFLRISLSFFHNLQVLKAFHAFLPTAPENNYVWRKHDTISGEMRGGPNKWRNAWKSKHFFFLMFFWRNAFSKFCEFSHQKKWPKSAHEICPF